MKNIPTRTKNKPNEAVLRFRLRRLWFCSFKVLVRLEGYLLLKAEVIMINPTAITNVAQKNLPDILMKDQIFQYGHSQGATCSSAETAPNATNARPIKSRTKAPEFI
jgi:hypothetical protein